MARYTRAANVNTLRPSALGRQPGFTAAVLCHRAVAQRGVESILKARLQERRACSRTPRPSEAEIPSQSQPGFSNRNPRGPVGGKVVICHIELGACRGAHRRKGQPEIVQGPRLGGKSLRWPPRFPALVYTPSEHPPLKYKLNLGMWWGFTPRIRVHSVDSEFIKRERNQGGLT